MTACPWIAWLERVSDSAARALLHRDVNDQVGPVLAEIASDGLAPSSRPLADYELLARVDRYEALAADLATGDPRLAAELARDNAFRGLVR